MGSVTLIWEGKGYDVPTSEFDAVDFVTLLQSLGKEGRSDLLGVLIINYREELKQELKQIERFERKQFT